MASQVERAPIGRITSPSSPASSNTPQTGEHPRRLHEMFFPKHLLAVIRRERARADRQKGQFSLVMFRLVPARGRWATLRLGKIVMDEVRATDEVGQFDRHTICALLPDTAPDGAWKLIDRVDTRSRDRKMAVEPVVYTYPSSWFDQNNNKGGGSSDGKSSNGSARSSGSTNVASWVKAAEDAEDESPAARTNVLPLESLLMRPPSLMKRTLDIVIASIVLLLASPVMIISALLIKFGSEGPVIFKQWRSGMGGQPFQIYKFRTMCVNADALKAKLRAQSEQDGPAFKMTRDPRVTRVGQFLRKTSLDELPQLLNVLKGEMSLVGPRPLPLDEQAQCDQWQKGRLDVAPGLTCVWQVKGRSQVSFEEWMRMDLGYIKKYQVWEDLKLIFQTIPAVLLRRGAK